MATDRHSQTETEINHNRVRQIETVRQKNITAMIRLKICKKILNANKKSRKPGSS